MTNRIPHHVAIIMDGNGRWAKQRGLPRLTGHQAGSDRVKQIVRVADRIGVRVITFYAFSEENWARPAAEVSGLMMLIKDYLVRERQEIIDNNIRFQIFGELQRLPTEIGEVVSDVIEVTKNNTGLVLNFAVSYGGRQEILRAVNQILSDTADGSRPQRPVTLKEFSGYLYTGELPDPDLIIRTSGEQRVSNFLLWQLAYSEIYITETLWPDFTETAFLEALDEFQRRSRRFGKTDEQLVADTAEGPSHTVAKLH